MCVCVCVCVCVNELVSDRQVVRVTKCTSVSDRSFKPSLRDFVARLIERTAGGVSSSVLTSQSQTFVS